MAKKPLGLGKLPKRPKDGRWSEPGGMAGLLRTNNFDQVLGQPKRKSHSPGV